MIPRLLSFPRLQYSRSIVILSGSAITYSFYQKRTIIYNDSGKEVPQSRLPLAKLKADNPSSNATPVPEQDVPVVEKGSSWLGNDDSAAWTLFSSSFASAGSSISSIKWAAIGDSITDYMVPEWAKMIPGYAKKLQLEFDMAPGSLADEVWEEASDSSINPEIVRTARVRIGKELCAEEKAFQSRRRQCTAQALAKYLNIPEHEIDPEDVPTIAMCGSGGGLRALVAGTASQLSAQEAGLFDCVTYTAGVSGSCWLQALYNSSIAGQYHDRLIEHLKRRIGVHIAFPPPALNLFTSAPTNKFLLSGFIEKLKGNPEADFGVVDAYGLLLAARLLVPRGELAVDARDLKLSNQRSFVDNGTNPLPIYTAVRHEIPLDEVKTIEEKVQGGASQETKEKAKQRSWFQWFEFTPYEFWCEELDAGIPIWSLGRQFRDGVDVPRENGLGLPELRIPQLLGIWGSAFCATLSHYYKEIRPVVKGVAMFSGVDDLIEERNDDLIKVHPINPASIPNFALGLKGFLPPTCPESIHTATHLQLMDAGMSNNLPIYPLLRPGRNVDILIAFDASADIKTENWISVADTYVAQHGIKGWPTGLGWPKNSASYNQSREELEATDSASAQEAAVKVAKAREERRRKHNQTESVVPTSTPTSPEEVEDLSYCTVWVGSTVPPATTGSHPSQTPTPERIAPATLNALLSPDAGIAVVYMPFLPNPKVAGVDPNTSDFMSTWNFVYTPEQIDKVVALARANFEEGREQVKECVRAVYKRKRAARVGKESQEELERWRGRMEVGGDHFG
ncbi:hypothetical protein MMC19_004666 [Ptychographa xylographoides]|nr:hypothetical protein [Ptychographa xylographoides]